ncbi:MAG: hypothetical protein HXX09_04425 [Bacteroidetes bacterium]|nr:hypothetical protein [Bacteroidota bacterium]
MGTKVLIEKEEAISIDSLSRSELLTFLQRTKLSCIKNGTFFLAAKMRDFERKAMLALEDEFYILIKEIKEFLNYQDRNTMINVTRKRNILREHRA